VNGNICGDYFCGAVVNAQNLIFLKVNLCGLQNADEIQKSYRHVFFYKRGNFIMSILGGEITTI
jgi:hypothetical protein